MGYKFSACTDKIKTHDSSSSSTVLELHHKKAGFGAHLHGHFDPQPGLQIAKRGKRTPSMTQHLARVSHAELIHQSTSENTL